MAAAPAQAPAQMPMDQESPQEDQQPGDSKEEALTNMIISTDQALTKISQVIGKSIPQAGQALAKINEQYRQIISAVMNQGQGGQQQAAPQPSMAETAGAKGKVAPAL